MLGIDTEGKDKKWVLQYFEQALQREEPKLYGKLTDDHNVPHEVVLQLNIFLSSMYISFKKLEMDHDTVRDPSSHPTKKDQTSLKTLDKKDKYTYACYDSLKSIYALDERFFKFLNFLSKQPVEQSLNESFTVFLNYKILGIDNEGKDKKWVLQYFEQLKGVELYGKLDDDDKIPREAEEQVIAFLSNMYIPYKTLEMKHNATWGSSGNFGKKDKTPPKKPSKQLESNATEGRMLLVSEGLGCQGSHLEKCFETSKLSLRNYIG